jgi:hypothetical protein
MNEVPSLLCTVNHYSFSSPCDSVRKTTGLVRISFRKQVMGMRRLVGWLYGSPSLRAQENEPANRDGPIEDHTRFLLHESIPFRKV